MTCQQLWALFLATGLPQAYTLYGLLRDGGRPLAAPTGEDQNQKTA